MPGTKTVAVLLALCGAAPVLAQPPLAASQAAEDRPSQASISPEAPSLSESPSGAEAGAPTGGKASGESRPAASALELADRLRFCASSPDPRSRTKCYDDVSTNIGANVAHGRDQRAQQGAGLYEWTTMTRTSGGRPVPIVMLSASDVSMDQDPLSHPQAVLVVRCQDRETHLFLAFGRSVVPGMIPVTLRIDGKSAFTSTWEASTSGSSAGLWNPEKSIPLIKQMMGASRLTVQAPLRTGLLTATFDLPGMSDAVDPVRQVCKW